MFSDSWMLLITLIVMAVMVQFSFARGRGEAARVSVNAAELLALYRDSQTQLNKMQEQYNAERTEVQRELFKLQVKLQVYEERMRAAGITLDVDTHARLHIAIYDLILHHMGLNELRTAVFYLNMNWDMIEGETLPLKAQSLVTQLEREGKMDGFLIEMRQRFPHIPWPQTDGQGRPMASPPPKEERPITPNSKRTL